MNVTDPGGNALDMGNHVTTRKCSPSNREVTNLGVPGGHSWRKLFQSGTLQQCAKRVTGGSSPSKYLGSTGSTSQIRHLCRERGVKSRGRRGKGVRDDNAEGLSRQGGEQPLTEILKPNPRTLRVSKAIWKDITTAWALLESPQSRQPTA